MRLKILAFAAGALFVQVQPALPEFLPWALAGALLGLPRLRYSGAPARWLVVLACFALGVSWAAWRAEIRLADRLDSAWEGRDIEVVGVVASLPQDFSQGTRFEFCPDFPLTAGVKLPDRVMLSWYQGRRDGEDFMRLPVKPGERWRFTVRLKRPHGNANPGGFDYEAWLLERNIRATGYIRQNPAERMTDMVWRPDFVIERLRHAARESFSARLPAEHFPLAGVLVALAIGDQRAIHGDLWSIFNRTGTTHLMSISGLHITMLAALFGWLVSFVWRRIPALALRLPAQKAGLLSGCLAAIGYAFLAGFAVPAQRTLYMLLVAALAVFSGRLVAPSRILALGLLVVLLLDPWAVLAAGFWLSFGAVAALLYVGISRVGESGDWWAQLRRWGGVQWAATLASLPILLLVFQQFSLVSPLSNALAIPVISFVVTPLVLLGTLIPWTPILLLAHAVMDWLMYFLTACATWPVWQAPAPPLWVAILAACGVAVCLLPRGFPGRLLGGLMLLPAVFWPLEKPLAGEVWVTVLDVGQGLASLVRTREHTLLYDPGPLYSAESDAGQRVVVPYLRYLGINRIDTLMVTHRDSDHAGGASSVLSGVAVGELHSSVREYGGKICGAGQSWRWDGVLFEVLHPQADAYDLDLRSNHVSCVLKVSAGGRSILLTSDIEAADEFALLSRNREALAADVLLVPHHGSRTSSTEAFLAAVDAKTAVIPVGYRNRFGHPKEEVVARYRSTGATLWRTDRDGAVDIRISQDGVKVSTWRAEHRRYWHGQ